ncbi:hypothetical protein RQP46_000266 [Phenoliferia psychrophenolica]
MNTLRQRLAPVLKRAYSTSPAAYPFSSTAASIPSSSTPTPRTTSLLTTLNRHLVSLSPLSSSYLPLFSRRHPSRLLPGSVLTISSYSTPPTAENPTPTSNSFSGVLIAIRRRHAGRDTSIRLRNTVGRTGVEVAYKVFSPLLKEIKVVSRAAWSGPAVVGKDGKEGVRRKPQLQAAKRAKLYFVRDQPARSVSLRLRTPSWTGGADILLRNTRTCRLVSVGGIVKQQRERELLAETRKGGRR